MNYYGYIYKLTLKPTGKIYIGKREKSHFDKSYWGGGSLWNKVISDYTRDDIDREVLEWCDTREELLEREIYWIDKLNSRNPDIGYNVSKGGENGAYGCSIKHSKKWNANIGNGNRGIKHSDESKLNMKTGLMKYRKNHPEWKEVAIKGFVEFYKNNPNAHNTRGISVKCVETGVVYKTLAEAKIDTGAWDISMCIRGYINTSGGYHWEIVSGKLDCKKPLGIMKPVKCVETGKIYESIKAAELEYHCGHISEVCNGVRKTSAGYHWEWVK